MREKRNSSQTKFGEATKVIRLPETLANFLQRYPSVINELVSQIKDGEINLSIDVTALPVTANNAYDIQSMIDDALNSKIKELREEFEEHERIYQAQCQKGFELQIATFREEMNEAIATAKKPPLSVMREKVIAA